MSEYADSLVDCAALRDLVGGGTERAENSNFSRECVDM
jgi:hypothetical protein